VKQQGKSTEQLHRINENIRGVKEVRLVGENVEPGVYPIEKALEIAEEQNLDLVEISAKADPPVCRVIDYQKFLFNSKNAKRN
jgi:translation initiation factor IF-3